MNFKMEATVSACILPTAPRALAASVICESDHSRVLHFYIARGMENIHPSERRGPPETTNPSRPDNLDHESPPRTRPNLCAAAICRRADGGGDAHPGHAAPGWR